MGLLPAIRLLRCRRYGGLLTRLAAKVAAFNLSISVKHHCAQPTFAVINPLTA